MNVTVKIENMCLNFLRDKKTYSLELHMAKNIILKIQAGRKLSKLDLDFLAKLQCGLIC